MRHSVTNLVFPDVLKKYGAFITNSWTLKAFLHSFIMLKLPTQWQNITSLEDLNPQVPLQKPQILQSYCTQQ